ncbi:putative 3-methyladenine DNA glycosylase [Caloramator mitchellensis]|uniref:Putative 3-methyladenine DNA glycosylase n=1 Tax=Caloramator mitchellensis TaxID=908809 RepID=A0A0R3JRJ8_CALMK|nr:DNA-3-methyladenine glycosylase [Caloramator mitchellensis]KRQ86102.1 putative 3-methyladenine DNA glycosylase [Caloramator mitchellensis]
MKLPFEFYDRDTLEVAKDLLGKKLVRKIGKDLLIGKIVEVEAYIGPIDKACHSYNFKKTKRNEVMFGPPGTAYIYFIYGMYHCLNIVTETEGMPCAVLVRAVEPLQGLDLLTQNRFGKKYNELNPLQRKNLTNSPGKLCKAFSIDKILNGISLLGDELYILDNDESFEIMSDKRIGIDYAEEAKDFEWRFFIKNNPFVSVLKKE